MSKTAKKNERTIGKTNLPEKKPIIDPRYKSFFQTVVFVIILIIFFIVNNTRNEPESGPYPPFYQKKSAPAQVGN